VLLKSSELTEEEITMATLTPIKTLDDNGLVASPTSTVHSRPQRIRATPPERWQHRRVCLERDTGSHTLTIKGQKDPYGVAVADLALVVAAGKIAMSPLLNPALFNLGGACTFTLSAVTGMKIGIYRLRKLR